MTPSRRGNGPGQRESGRSPGSAFRSSCPGCRGRQVCTQLRRWRFLRQERVGSRTTTVACLIRSPGGAQPLRERNSQVQKISRREKSHATSPGWYGPVRFAQLAGWLPPHRRCVRLHERLPRLCCGQPPRGHANALAEWDAGRKPARRAHACGRDAARTQHNSHPRRGCALSRSGLWEVRQRPSVQSAAHPAPSALGTATGALNRKYTCTLSSWRENQAAEGAYSPAGTAPPLPQLASRFRRTSPAHGWQQLLFPTPSCDVFFEQKALSNGHAWSCSSLSACRACLGHKVSYFIFV
jgi:hypothetical protein